MKQFVFLFILVSILACQKKSEPTLPVIPNKPVTPQDEVFPPSAYTELIWSDEFDNSAINLAKWQHEINDNGGGNNELQYYTDEPTNSFIKDGNLVIEARKESYKTRSYTSARLNTRNKSDFKYGKIEIRAKLPKGQGIWPALWMLPTDEEFGGWPKSGEIDIMEVVGHKPGTLHGTVHYGSAWPNNQYKGTSYVLPTGDFSNDFHVFSVVWDENLIRWYLDGTEFYRIKPADLSPHHYPFNARFHLLLNVAVGGNWPGNPYATTVFPQQMLVDYVRVYQRKE